MVSRVPPAARRVRTAGHAVVVAERPLGRPWAGAHRPVKWGGPPVRCRPGPAREGRTRPRSPRGGRRPPPRLRRDLQPRHREVQAVWSSAPTDRPPRCLLVAGGAAHRSSRGGSTTPPCSSSSTSVPGTSRLGGPHLAGRRATRGGCPTRTSAGHTVDELEASGDEIARVRRPDGSRSAGLPVSVWSVSRAHRVRPTRAMMSTRPTGAQSGMPDCDGVVDPAAWPRVSSRRVGAAGAAVRRGARDCPSSPTARSAASSPPTSSGLVDGGPASWSGCRRATASRVWRSPATSCGGRPSRTRGRSGRSGCGPGRCRWLALALLGGALWAWRRDSTTDGTPVRDPLPVGSRRCVTRISS